jgi:hypothetical protein
MEGRENLTGVPAGVLLWPMHGSANNATQLQTAPNIRFIRPSLSGPAKQLGFSKSRKPSKLRHSGLWIVQGIKATLEHSVRSNERERPWPKKKSATTSDSFDPAQSHHCAKRMECAQLAGAFTCVVGRKAGASSSRSMRFATDSARGYSCPQRFPIFDFQVFQTATQPPINPCGPENLHIALPFTNTPQSATPI